MGLAGYGVAIAALRGQEERSAAVAARPAQPRLEARLPLPDPPAQPSKPRIVQALLPGGAVIARLVPDGTLVKKGDFLCELGSPAVDAQLNEFRVAIESARAEHRAAELSREVAEYALQEYAQGQYPLQLMDAEGDIQLAKAELELAEEELKAANRGPAGDSVAVRRKGLDRLRARLALEKAQSRKDLLVKYTREVKQKVLEAAIQKARADEQARRTKWEHEVQEEKGLDACRIIVAPIAGRLRYRKEQGRPIETGAHVVYSQPLFRIDP